LIFNLVVLAMLRAMMAEERRRERVAEADTPRPRVVARATPVPAG
jgi:hypothetical protein